MDSCLQFSTTIKIDETFLKVARKDGAPDCLVSGYRIKPLDSTNSTFKMVNMEMPGHLDAAMICFAPYPLDFAYDGQYPEGEELRVEFDNIIQSNPFMIEYSATVTLSLKKKDSALLGTYSVFSVQNPTWRTSIHIFDGDSSRPPCLTHPNTQKEILVTRSDKIVTIDCKTNKFDSAVSLFSRRVQTNKTKQIGPSGFIRYDATKGFTWNTKGFPLPKDLKEFTYICQCKTNGTTKMGQPTKTTDSMEFTLVNETTVREQKSDSSMNLPSIDIDMVIEVINGQVQISCPMESHEVYLANVHARNTRELSLRQGCLRELECQHCLSRRVASAVSEEVGFGNTRALIVRPAYSQGLAHCSCYQNKNQNLSREYFRGLDDIIYYDWNVAKNATGALLRIKCLNSEMLYGNENYTFTCKSQTYILSPASLFTLHFQNGSTKEHFLEGDRKDLQKVTFALFTDIAKVSCSALPWNSSVYVNTSMDLKLRDRRAPNFEIAETTLVLHRNSLNSQLQCESTGDELPTISWKKNGKELNDSTLRIKTEPGYSSISFPSISLEDRGEYKCIAVNSVGESSKIYHVQIDDPDATNYGVVIGVPLGILFVLLVMTITTSYGFARHFYKKRMYLTQDEIDEFRHGVASKIKNEKGNGVQYGPYNYNYEIETSQFQLDESCILGSGQFGIVYKGLYNNAPIAIKTLRPNIEKAYLKAMLTELKVMIYINGHKNIVNLIGANTESLDKGLVYAFVEFCPLGSLESFLRRYQNNFVNQLNEDGSVEINGQNTKPEIENSLYTRDLVLWATQISSGLEYLACKNVIHGDLATRNVLLLNRGIAKITDFGLSKKLYDYEIYHKRNLVPLPWRWLAIESLKNLTFSSKSDVWAFGVTLWEIFTLADVPYPGLSWSPEFLKQLQNGLRLTQPENASDEIYQVMLQCWKKEPEDRPCVSYLNKYFSNFLKKFTDQTESEYLELFQTL